MTQDGSKGNRVALVTGAAKGMGRAIALALSRRVSGVAVHYRGSTEEAGETVAEIERQGKRAASFGADLTDEGRAADLVRKVEKAFGRLDVLVNNIGPFLVKPWQELTGGDWDVMFRGVLESAHFCMKAALPGMRSRGWGRVINIGYSRAEQLGSFPTIVPYAIAKTGLLILTRTAAVSEVANGVTVNMVSPGLMEGGVLPPGKVPPAAIGKFADVAEAVAFLASDEAAAVTGANLIVAGTWRM
jgi:3-oxoacyl-[acyl-carrier protein] reductase